jgi:hypothetical protein
VNGFIRILIGIHSNLLIRSTRQLLFNLKFRVIFDSENDFSICLNQSFPKLKTRKLTRKQWCFVRNLIGKPRR